MSGQNQELILKNSIVYDSKHQINGEKKDLQINDGKIVDSLKDEKSAKEIDASGCITFPGFIDVRSHGFAQETIYHSILSQNYSTRFLHSSIMEIEQTALTQGFTFLCEMDVPLTQSKITLHNMQLSPLLDHAMILDIGSNWAFLSDLESESAVGEIANTISLLLGMTKGFGISTNCPYHQQYWKLEKIPYNSKIPMIPLNILQIYNLFTKAAVKNSIAPHFLSLYDKENSSVNQMEILNGIEQTEFTMTSANQYFHEDYSDFTKYHSTNKNVSCEITPFTLGTTSPLITRDRNLAIRESKSSGIPITTVDLEFDTEYYVTGRKVEENHPYLGNWIAMITELKRQSELKRVLLSSNAPYNMSISDWSKHIYDLVTETQNEVDLLDVCALLSTNPARTLNIETRKGHLGAGADADIVCFNANPENIDEKSFADAKFVIKSGQVIKKESRFTDPKSKVGKIFWRDGMYDATSMKKTRKRKELFYDKRFSMHLSSLDTAETSIMEKL